MRMLYRVNQFWQALFTNTDTEAYSQAQQLLTPAQWELFDALQPAERSHALAMYRKLLEQGETQPDLLIASLLHDVGKLRYRLNPLERAMIVLAKALLPHQVPRWVACPRKVGKASQVGGRPLSCRSSTLPGALSWPMRQV